MAKRIVHYVLAMCFHTVCSGFRQHDAGSSIEVADMRQAGINDNTAHPAFKRACAAVAATLRKYFKEGIAEHRICALPVMCIAQTYLQEIAVVRSENMFLRFAVTALATGYQGGQGEDVQTVFRSVIVYCTMMASLPDTLLT